MLKEELWKRRTMAKITMLRRDSIIERMELLNKIQWNRTKEQEVIQELRKEDEQSWKDDEMIYIDGWIYIPNNKKIQEQVLQKNHDLADVSHPEQSRMLELIKQNYWWPGIKEDIKKYIQECFKC